MHLFKFFSKHHSSLATRRLLLVFTSMTRRNNIFRDPVSAILINMIAWIIWGVTLERLILISQLVLYSSNLQPRGVKHSISLQILGKNNVIRISWETRSLDFWKWFGSGLKLVIQTRFDVHHQTKGFPPTVQIRPWRISPKSGWHHFSVCCSADFPPVCLQRDWKLWSGNVGKCHEKRMQAE